MTSGNEWYTPPTYTLAARQLMGAIDLDPASCAKANEFVQARHYYTREENGLTLPWFGRIFLNPPFGRTVMGRGSNLKHFCNKLESEYLAGNVEQAILLVPANTATSWFIPLWNRPICFPFKRIRFLQADGSPSYRQSFSTCFVYYGQSREQFAAIFRQFGHIVQPSATASYPGVFELWQSQAHEVIA